MSYEVGDLTLSISTLSKGASESIDATVKSLHSLSRAIKNVNAVSASVTVNKNNLANFFTSISKATAKINTKGLESIATVGKGISGISKITKLQDADWGKIATGFNNLTVAITPFVEKVNEASAGLIALDGVLSKSSGKKIQNLLNPTSPKKGGGSSLSSFLGVVKNAFKLKALLHITKRLASSVSNLAQAGGDYVETLNLWETSMNGNIEKAEKFIETMNKAYGISDKTLMQAQATFKNMLGALGNISDDVAYTLSEGVTQMALDYASLYNQSFDKAFNKFQAALAGQVRPIRSVSGYDITENTIYQLYTQLGGTKTMRQLNRTEKQLLSLLAIYNQMSATGALGDLAKTMNSYANQTRVAKEMMQEIASYAGVLATHWLTTSGLLTKITGHLIFFADVLKSAAEATGAIQHFANDPFASTEESANSASDAVDELNGKLLDFDKFRSLSGQETSYLTIDDKLLNAFGSLSSYLEKAQSDAHDFAEELKKASGLFNEDGTFNKDRWKELGNNIKTFATVVGIALGAVILVVNLLAISIGSVIMGIGLVATLWDKMTVEQRVLSSLWGLVAVLGVVVALLIRAKHPTWATYIAELGLLVAGIGATVTALTSVKAFKDGGLPDKGTMFLAGEAGAEIVYNTPSGQSGVVNVAQIKQAMYQALVEYGRTSGGNDRPIEVYLDGEKVYESTTSHASRHGKTWAKV